MRRNRSAASPTTCHEPDRASEPSVESTREQSESGRGLTVAGPRQSTSATVQGPGGGGRGGGGRGVGGGGGGGGCHHMPSIMRGIWVGE
uniref:Uncharacterized protein n=1 Tax=Knipowitschia caucasica TaxID=637954 RepID=A0AAV2KSC4_KNICA